MRLIMRLLLVVALLVGLAVMGAPAEGAAPPAVIVTPNDDLVELQTVTVAGTGFQELENDVSVCQGAMSEGCGNTVVGNVPISAAGEFSISYTVRRFMFVATLGQAVDCADPSANCVLYVFTRFAPSGSVAIPISFASPPPPPSTRGSIAVTPNTSLDNGDPVTVTGTGFRPDTDIEILQCAPAPTDPADCTLSQFTTATTNGAGTFTAQHSVSSVFSPPGRASINCRFAPGACVIAAAEVVDIPGTIVTAPLAFAGPSSTIVVTPNTDLRDGQSVSLAGSGFRPDVQHAFCQGVATAAPSASDCGTGFTVVTTDATGAFAGGQRLQRFIYVPSVGTTVDCANTVNACVIGAAEAFDIARTATYAPLHFAVAPPLVIAGTASTGETNSGSHDLMIPVSLSGPSAEPATVEWTTSFLPGNSGDQAEPPADYTASSGTVTFAAGQTEQSVLVSVNGDVLFEPDEYIVISFRNPTNAAMGGFWGLGVGIIQNDDARPKVLPGMATISESDVGSDALLIPVSLSSPSAGIVTVEWTTLFIPGRTDNQAVAPSDYAAASGTVTFAHGQTQQSVAVSVHGDTDIEPDEYIVISFRNPTNALMGGFWGLSLGRILNDD